MSRGINRTAKRLLSAAAPGLNVSAHRCVDGTGDGVSSRSANSHDRMICFIEEQGASNLTPGQKF